MKNIIDHLRWFDERRLTDQHINLMKKPGPVLGSPAYVHVGLASAIIRLLHAYNDCSASPMLTKSSEDMEIWRHRAKTSRHVIANVGAEPGRPRLIIRSGCKSFIFVTM